MTVSSSYSLHVLRQATSPRFPPFSLNFQSNRSSLRFSKVQFQTKIRCSSSVTIQPDSSSKQNQISDVDPFACPVCYEPLIRKGPPGFNLSAIYRSGFKCDKCNKTYSSKDNYLDLTLTAGMKEYVEVRSSGTELFRSPIVSFLYERGWRQNFNRRGFPGPDEEFKMAQEYFKSAVGGILVDVSCGSGLFSRKFAKSRAYSKVIALDFSENMLRQCYDFIKKDPSILTSNLALVRADVSRLPFPSGSIDAIHAGAALHCWPSPSNAAIDSMFSPLDNASTNFRRARHNLLLRLISSFSSCQIAEICRLLRSGGVFVGTTFLRTGLESQIPSAFRQAFSRAMNYFTEKEIEDLCTSCGLTNYTSKVQQTFIMFSAQKP